MPFRRIHLPAVEDFLNCTIATIVLEPDVRTLKGIAELVVEHGYDWCISHKDPHKKDAWWQTVRQIQEAFSWEKLAVGDPITAKVYNGTLEFGSINEYGGGCHRTIAIAAAVLGKQMGYRAFDILLYCP